MTIGKVKKVFFQLAVWLKKHEIKYFLKPISLGCCVGAEGAEISGHKFCFMRCNFSIRAQQIRPLTTIYIHFKSLFSVLWTPRKTFHSIAVKSLKIYLLLPWQLCEITTEPWRGGWRKSANLKESVALHPARHISLSGCKSIWKTGRNETKLKASRTKRQKANRPKQIYFYTISIGLMSFGSYICQNNFPLHQEGSVTGSILE